MILTNVRIHTRIYVLVYTSIDFQEADGAAARLVEGILRRKSFYFQQRTGKLDMRAIGRVDVERVIKDVDIDTLQVSDFPVPCSIRTGGRLRV